MGRNLYYYFIFFYFYSNSWFKSFFLNAPKKDSKVIWHKNLDIWTHVHVQELIHFYWEEWVHVTSLKLEFYLFIFMFKIDVYLSWRIQGKAGTTKHTVVPNLKRITRGIWIMFFDLMKKIIKGLFPRKIIVLYLLILYMTKHMTIFKGKLIFFMHLV